LWGAEKQNNFDIYYEIIVPHPLKTAKYFKVVREDLTGVDAKTTH
jgi:hypothetical protein